jgi:uncharacterized protein (TIGR03437 family)
MTPSVCTVSGNTVNLVNAGTCIITAAQAGNNVYNPASPVFQNFTVTSQLVPSISSVANAASYFALPLAAESYAVVFGGNLAMQVGDPTVAVTITDSSGNQVSSGVLYAGSTQINILVPDGLALGAATLKVSNSLGTSVGFPVTVATIAPGLFTVDSAGTIPAGQVVTVNADNTQTVQPIATCAGGTCVAAPIALNPTLPTYLILYGTGLRGVSSLVDVAVTIGGVPATETYTGRQGGYPGLDQVNVLIPPALAGRGQVDVKLTIFSDTANTVELVFQ